MGWNYGGAVIDFDFLTVLREVGDVYELRRHGGESPEELAQKDRIDAGTIALSHFPWGVNPADAPMHFEEASRFSLFKQGKRVRFFSSGPGLADDEGAPLAEEGDQHPYDRIKAIVKSMLGDVDLFEVPFEKFDSV